MNPGKFRDEITLQSESGSVAASGEYVKAWTLYAARMAWVKTPSMTGFLRSSKENTQDNRITRENTFLIQLRFDEDINSAMRVLWRDHIFEIDGITADVHNSQYMWLHCLDTVRAGQGFGSAKGSPVLAVTIDAAAVVSGVVQSMPAVSVSQGGTQGTPVTVTVTLTNSGTLPLTITVPVAFLGDDTPTGFTITTQPSGTVAAAADTTLVVSFTVPDSAVETQALGTVTNYSATIPIQTDDETTPQFLLALKATVTVVA